MISGIFDILEIKHEEYLGVIKYFPVQSSKLCSVKIVFPENFGRFTGKHS